MRVPLTVMVYIDEDDIPVVSVHAVPADATQALASLMSARWDRVAGQYGVPATPDGLSAVQTVGLYMRVRYAQESYTLTEHVVDVSEPPPTAEVRQRLTDTWRALDVEDKGGNAGFVEGVLAARGLLAHALNGLGWDVPEDTRDAQHDSAPARHVAQVWAVGSTWYARCWGDCSAMESGAEQFVRDWAESHRRQAQRDAEPRSFHAPPEVPPYTERGLRGPSGAVYRRQHPTNTMWFHARDDGTRGPWMPLEAVFAAESGGPLTEVLPGDQRPK